MSKTLYLIDVYSLVFQVFHAIPEMTSPDGLPVNAVYGFTRDVLTILQKKKPAYIIAAMDASGPAVRVEWYPEYKANREEMPDNLRPQVPMIIEMLEGFGIPVLEAPGWEADDIIATVVKEAGTAKIDVVIVTTDKDARQLLGPTVRMFNARKNSFLGPEELLEDWGITPDQVVDFQSLVGDSVDNVPGVPLVGPKKASALLKEHGTLEQVLANADCAPGAKLRENLKTYAEQALMSRKLVKLYDDIPLDLDWEKCRTGQLNCPQLLELFTRLNFRTFREAVLLMQPKSEAAPTLTRTWHVVDTPEALEVFIAELAKHPKFCLDLETTNLDANRASIVGWAFSWETGNGYYLPVQGPPGQRKLDSQKVLAALKPYLEDPNVEIVNQNVKYDMLVLRRAGCRITAIGLDPMVGSYLLDAGARSHGLDELAIRYLNHKMIPITKLIGTGRDQMKMYQVGIEQVAEYAVEDAEISWQLAELLEKQLKEQDLWDLYWDLERPLIHVLTEMEATGIRVNTDLLKSLSKDAGEKLALMDEEIFELAGRTFNPDSPTQLRQLLYKDLGLRVVKKTKTGASTDQDVLEELAREHPLPMKLLERRKLAKLKSTYLDALPEMVNPDTGKIHASFNQVVAATGRLSSSDPNLQNIPIRTEEGRRIREAFIPAEPGWELVSADYSQIELRMLAHFSHDEALTAAFSNGEDIHTTVAADIYQVEPEGVTSEMRRVAKAVNFGVIYGQSAYGLAASLGIPQEEAAKFIEEYFTRYAGVSNFLKNLLEVCREKRYAQTILGRRRAISGIRQSHSRRQLNLPERTAINTVIQGSAADLIKQAMIQIQKRLHDVPYPAHMLLQIHDELVFETPRENVPDLIELVRTEMVSSLNLDVPLSVDIGHGADWLNTK